MKDWNTLPSPSSLLMTTIRANSNKPKRREASARVTGTDEARKGNEMAIHTTVITFETDRELTDEELNRLEGNLMLQIQEPTNDDNDAEEYETQLLNIETK